MSARTAHPKEHQAWRSMRRRCLSPGSDFYDNYGGRGIRICERWSEFAQFFEDVGASPSARHSLDRIDVNGHYEPGNIRWATPTEQMNNTTRNYWHTFEGRTQTMAQWVRELGLEYSTAWKRVKRGLPMMNEKQADIYSGRKSA